MLERTHAYGFVRHIEKDESGKVISIRALEVVPLGSNKTVQEKLEKLSSEDVSFEQLNGDYLGFNAQHTSQRGQTNQWAIIGIRRELKADVLLNKNNKAQRSTHVADQKTRDKINGFADRSRDSGINSEKPRLAQQRANKTWDAGVGRKGQDTIGGRQRDNLPNDVLAKREEKATRRQKPGTRQSRNIGTVGATQGKLVDLPLQFASAAGLPTAVIKALTKPQNGRVKPLKTLPKRTPTINGLHRRLPTFSRCYS